MQGDPSPLPPVDEFIRQHILPIFDAAEVHGLTRQEVIDTVEEALYASGPPRIRSGVPLWSEKVVEALARKIEEGR